MLGLQQHNISTKYGQPRPRVCSAEAALPREGGGRMAAAGTVFMASDGKYPCRELGLIQPGVHYTIELEKDPSEGS